MVLDACGADNSAGLDLEALQKFESPNSAAPLQLTHPQEGAVYALGAFAPSVIWNGLEYGARAVFLRLKNRSFEYRGCLLPTGPNMVRIPEAAWTGAAAHAAAGPFVLELSVMRETRVWGPARVSFRLVQTAEEVIATIQNDLVGPLLGVDAPQLPDPESEQVHGTDLGVPVQHGDEVVLLFGDSYDTPRGTYNPERDDVGAFFPMDAGSIDRVPPLTLQSDWITVLPQGGATGLEMGPARTPIAAVGFGDMPWYALFLRGGAYAPCNTDADCGGLVCDQRMGVLGDVEAGPFAVEEGPCVRDDSGRSPCQPPKGYNGLCRDPTSSLASYEGGEGAYLAGPDAAARTANGLMTSVGNRHEFGRVRQAPGGTIDMTVYDTTPFITNKFLNATMRASRGINDYRPPEGPPFGESAIWLWGRPAFWSDPVHGAIAPLYLAVTTQNALAQTGEQPRLEPLFFGGVRSDPAGNGSGPTPVWTTDQVAAVPLAAVDNWAGDGGFTGHMSVIYAPALGKWFMLYGGGMPSFWHTLFGQETGANLGDLADGPVKLRVADAPWGPWSAPRQVIGPDDAPIAVELVGRSGSSKEGTVGLTQFVAPQGVLYGVQIFEPWVRTRDEKVIELAWFVSTWNPYQVQQMKTSIELK